MSRINRGAEGRILSIAQMERVSSRPRRVSSRHWRGITSSFCCIAACMHACMHARHGMRAASGARAPRRKAAGGQLETGSRQGTRWSGIKRSSPTGMYRGVKFYFPVENLPRSVTCYLIQRKKKKKKTEATFLAFRPPRRREDRSILYRIDGNPVRSTSVSGVSSQRGRGGGRRSGIGSENEAGRNSLTDWRTRGGRRGEWRG